MKIEVNYIGRVEGHAHLKVSSKDGSVEEIRLEIVETPRFFENFIKGKPWHEVQIIVSRICGICSIAHSFASLKATEAALNVKIPFGVELLRKLLLNGETIQSHILHICFLALPDFFGEGSVIPLAEKNPELVKLALRLKKLGNEICDLIGGRTTHPVNLCVGGFNFYPDKETLLKIKNLLIKSAPELDILIDLFSKIEIPDFKRKVNSIALSKKNEYAFYDGVVKTSLEEFEVSKYLDYIKEYIVERSTAKHTSYRGSSYRVGALARYELNKEYLLKEAKIAAEKLKLDENIYNPYYNTHAQIVEVVQVFYESIMIIDELLDSNYEYSPIVVPSEGRGVGIVEAPRGLLIHDYTYDSKGYIVKANCIIPTAQNLANIEGDLIELMPKIIDKKQSEIQLICEMLIRAYDPCISCATHFVEIEFK
ncbi:MAG: Ni/Fe hydrogenase subunit alpha [bacterium]|nr:Ni/Fe hydrogenase subunit alpha [bacterium]